MPVDWASLAKTGPKMLKDAFGPSWGLRIWRALLAAVVACLFIGALAYTAQFGRTAMTTFGGISGGKAPEETSQLPDNAIRDIKDNKGIITQGQSGDNSISK